MEVKSLLSGKMRKGLQDALYVELYQSNLWKSLANQLQKLGLFGTQKYFLAESAEELTHYQMIVEFMNLVRQIFRIFDHSMKLLVDNAEIVHQFVISTTV